tara:strand:- start:52 stop:1437 length:1386 start_codon:yes stop_codon:yes gene_type:complete
MEKKRKAFTSLMIPPPPPRKKRNINNKNSQNNKTNMGNFTSLIKKRIKFEDQILPANKHPIYKPKNNKCYIEDIPPEIIGMIFEHVSDFQDLLNISMVCKRWRQMISEFSNPSFISKKYPVIVRKNLRNFHIQAITKQFPKIRQISLYNCPSIHNEGFLSIAKNCHKLEILKLHTVGYCPDTFMNNIMVNSALKELELNGNIELWNHDELPYFKLKKMIIVDNQNFYDKSVEVLSQKCHQLESLFISGCSNFNLENERTESETCFDIENMINFLKYNKDLKELYLGKINITNKVLEGVAQCSQLEILKIEQCFLVSDEGIRKLVDKLPNLKHITINYTDCTAVAFNLLTDPIDFPNLEEIVFNNNNRSLLINANQLYINDLISAIYNSRKEKNKKKVQPTHRGPIDEKINQIKKNGDKLKIKLINLQEAFNHFQQNFYHKSHTENLKIRHFLQKIDLKILF